MGGETQAEDGPQSEPEEGIEGEAEILLTSRTDRPSPCRLEQTSGGFLPPAPSPRWIKSMGMNRDPHALSHWRSGSPSPHGCQPLAGQEMHRRCFGQVSSDVLKRTKEADGSGLFDHTILSWGTNLRHGHMIKDVPAIVAGGLLDVKMGHGI